jgi:hypothetical protein
MWRRLLLLTAAIALLLGQPASAIGFPLIRPSLIARIVCEAICAEKAKENCTVIDSMKCNFYITGCLSGCSYGTLIKQK